jgi:hypothetical protein
LEHPDRVGGAEHVVDALLLLRQGREVIGDAVVLGDQLEAVLQRREHAEAEEVELHQTDLRAVVLVPLQNRPAGHPSPLHRTDLDHRTVAHHHAAGVDAQVPRRILQFRGERDYGPGHVGVDELFCRATGARVAGGVAPVITLLDLLAPRVLLARGVTECFGDVAHRRLRPVGDDVRYLRGAFSAVQVVDVLDRFLTAVGLDVDVDIGWLAALRRKEALEHQPVVDGVDRGDLQRVTDRRIRRRAASLTQNAFRPAEPGYVPHDEEVAGEVELLDDRELVFDDVVCLRLVRFALEPPRCALVSEVAQVAHLGVPVRARERWQVGRDQLQREGDLFLQPHRVMDGVRPAGEPRRHLLPGAQVLACPGS